MSEGLITRLGKWMDSRFETCATENALKLCSDSCQERHELITVEVNHLTELVDDLKKRMSKVETYTGMVVKVTTPGEKAVAKSAFTM